MVAGKIFVADQHSAFVGDGINHSGLVPGTVQAVIEVLINSSIEVQAVKLVIGERGGGSVHRRGWDRFGFGLRKSINAVALAHVGVQQGLQTRYTWFFSTDEFVSIFMERDINVIQQLEPLLDKNGDIILAIGKGKIILFLLKLFFGG
eukprot:CAMPEP_0113306146 /NCGR_PEP_ID=MMETSP0010_2-20120614/5511_1 /TAXON_ID=216773 ORGANISM="Corethron hystrix, Strain 308" /NCGR_SAMPLE_ID=MMETSP0010_2 /ASSEMBLY_ACC=CAM_ASM_000155 /LENGTH=147 /DNA_ID=CAMNT_0000160749 /DNA_START=844 /DNA_END=1287 /DNA_ORIENTATION=+ /assembly_acc=CAM_ASM_000155